MNKQTSGAPKPLSEDDAFYGAAYRVVFERVRNPDNCSTAEQLVELSAIVAAIREWSHTPEPSVMRSYERACGDVLKRAQTMVENAQRSQRMLALYATLPKPPESTPLEKAV